MSISSSVVLETSIQAEILPHGKMNSRTTQSRPVTARVNTAQPHEAGFVISVMEGRGVARQVGLATLNKETGRVFLAQVGLFWNSSMSVLDVMACHIGHRLPNLRQNVTSNASVYTRSGASTGHGRVKR